MSEPKSNLSPSEPCEQSTENLAEVDTPYEDDHEPVRSVSQKILRNEENEPKHTDEEHHGYEDFQQ